MRANDLADSDMTEDIEVYPVSVIFQHTCCSAQDTQLDSIMDQKLESGFSFKEAASRFALFVLKMAGHVARYKRCRAALRRSFGLPSALP